MLEEQLDKIERLIVPEKKLPLRMWYMYKDKRCTLIDVDDAQQIMQIKNYVRSLQFRVFGVVEDPNYQEYQEFLESRVFPRTRDKMKLILEDLNLPCYAPLFDYTKDKRQDG